MPVDPIDDAVYLGCGEPLAPSVEHPLLDVVAGYDVAPAILTSAVCLPAGLRAVAAALRVPGRRRRDSGRKTRIRPDQPTAMPAR